MQTLFTAEIDGWASWEAVFQSIEAFAPLIERILRRHTLPAAPVEHCTPGTNAVFRAGKHVVKIFAPRESGAENEAEARTERFAIARANALGVPAPSLVAAELFAFDGDFLRGYFAGLDAEAIAEICFEGLAIHDFGGDIVREHLGAPARFARLSDLKGRLYEAVRAGLARAQGV